MLQNPVTELVQTLVGLPLRTPPGYVPHDSDAEECTYNELEPLKADQATLDLAERRWRRGLGELCVHLPIDLKKLTEAEQVCHGSSLARMSSLDPGHHHLYDAEVLAETI